MLTRERGPVNLYWPVVKMERSQRETFVSVLDSHFVSHNQDFSLSLNHTAIQLNFHITDPLHNGHFPITTISTLR